MQSVLDQFDDCLLGRQSGGTFQRALDKCTNAVFNSLRQLLGTHIALAKLFPAIGAYAFNREASVYRDLRRARRGSNLARSDEVVRSFRDLEKFVGQIGVG